MINGVENIQTKNEAKLKIIEIFREYSFTYEQLMPVAVALADSVLRHDELIAGNLEKEHKCFQALLHINLPKNSPAIGLAEIIFDRWVTKSNNAFAIVYREGLIVERKRNKAVSTAKAVNGRKLIGAASRAKVQKQAKNFRHLSKDSAAPAIANAVGLSPGTVRRYLTELFPGPDWKA